MMSSTTSAAPAASASGKENETNTTSLLAKKEDDTNKKAAAAALKRGDDDNDEVEETAPYMKRIQEFQRAARHQAAVAKAATANSSNNNNDPILFYLFDEDNLLWKAKVTEEDTEEMDEEEKNKLLSKLSQEQVDQNVHAMILSNACFRLKEQYYEDILYADNRYNNSREEESGCGMVTLNTDSSWCMYPVISKQFSTAVRELNKAEKAVKQAPVAASAGSTRSDSLTTTNGVAQKALEVTVAAILAAHNMDHWRCDTDAAPEEVVIKLAKRMTELVKKLLWFTDAELGCWNDNDNGDSFSRKGWLHYLENVICSDWKSTVMDYGSNYNTPTMNFRTAKNGYGMGRRPIQAAASSATTSGDSNPSPTKKAKTMAVLAAAAPSVNNAGAASAVVGAQKTLTTYFNDIQPKLKDRVKTMVQLEITDLQQPSNPTSKKQQPPRVEHVVVTGASDMKKMHQLLAYLTGLSPLFDYHAQKGGSSMIPGARFELHAGGPDSDYRPCWIVSSASEAKKATKKGSVDAVVDKSIKIVQVFQGLNCSSNSGIFFDSDLAKTIAKTQGSLVFVTPNNDRFAISVKAIAPKKCVDSNFMALPRIVTYGDTFDKQQRKSGLGVLTLSDAKRVMQGGRRDPSFIFFRNETQSHVNKSILFCWKTPICAIDGGNVCPPFASYSTEWQEANVQSAGPPDAYYHHA